MNPANFPQNKKRKQQEATDRQSVYDGLSLETKLSMLDRRPGNSKRERIRLETKIKEAKKATKTK